MTCKELVNIIGIEYKLISEYLNELGYAPAISKRYTPRIVSHAVKSNCQLLNSALIHVADAHAEKLKSISKDDNTVYFLTYAVVDSMGQFEFHSKSQILDKVRKLRSSLL